MNKSFCRLLAALPIFLLPFLAFADEFKSLTFNPATPQTIRVHGDQFMVIRNFTQEGGKERGLVTVTNLHTNETAQVLTAAILNTSSSTVEVINNVIIAGPADVMMTCGSDATGNCFISYRKDGN